MPARPRRRKGIGKGSDPKIKSVAIPPPTEAPVKRSQYIRRLRHTDIYLSKLSCFLGQPEPNYLGFTLYNYKLLSPCQPPRSLQIHKFFTRVKSMVP